MARQGRSEKLTAFALLLMVGGVASCDQAGNPGVGETQAAGMERWSYQDWPTGPYQVALDWPKPLPDDRHSHDGWTWGSMGGVYAESPDRIWVAMRGELPLPEGAAPWTAYGATNLVGNATGNGDGIGATCNVSQNRRGWERRFEHSIIVLDGDGNLVDEWPYADELFSQLPCGRGPHQIKMSPYDPEKHVWIIDDQLHVIYKFTYDGELVLTHGTLGERGRDAARLFDRPTDIAWLPDGTYFISDGYGGTRVAKFDADDNFLMDWGEPVADRADPQPNEFQTVHSIAISEDRRIFVLDRGNARMQVFDEDGTFLDMWPLTSPHWGNQGTLMANHLVTTDGYIWVGDAPTSRLLKFDLEGNFLYSWGAPGIQAGRLACSHGITTDQDGNLFVADCFAGRVQKFVPIPGVDMSKVVGQILREYPID